jgi:hypothetical protein
VGIGFVLLIWTAAGLIVASVGAVVLGTATSLATPEVPRFRRLTIFAASAFPFVCLCWSGALFVFQAPVNQLVLHRDPGLGDTWECPLPNRYSLLMIDKTENGWIYNRATQSIPGGVAEQEDAIARVAVVQVAGRYILGRVDGAELDGPDIVDGVAVDAAKKHADSFFLLDTQTGKRKDFPDYKRLASAAQSLAIEPRLEPMVLVYRHYRFTWFDVFAGFLFIAPPVLGLVSLTVWILYLRRRTAAA